MADLPDRAAVVRVLEQAFPAPIAVEKLEQLSGGASAETCALDVKDGAGAQHALILRREATRGSAFRAGVGKREEGLTQKAAFEHGVPAAEVVVMFDHDPELGSGYIMRRLAGESIPRKLLRDAPYTSAHGRLADDCARALAAIHRVPRAALPPLPEQPVRAQLALTEQLHRGFGQPVPTFEVVLRWLKERIPPERPPALVHGDFRLGNLLIDGNGLVAVLDWELVHVGDPLEDLGWLCVPAWRFGGELPVGGFAKREELHRAYERAGGLAVDPVEARFWEIFGALRWGVICQWQAFAHLSGATPSVERATIGRRVTEVELDLLLLLEGVL